MHRSWFRQPWAYRRQPELPAQVKCRIQVNIPYARPFQRARRAVALVARRAHVERAQAAVHRIAARERCRHGRHRIRLERSLAPGAVHLPPPFANPRLPVPPFANRGSITPPFAILKLPQRVFLLWRCLQVAQSPVARDATPLSQRRCPQPPLHSFAWRGSGGSRRVRGADARGFWECARGAKFCTT